jgi:hypothetical protein
MEKVRTTKLVGEPKAQRGHKYQTRRSDRPDHGVSGRSATLASKTQRPQDRGDERREMIVETRTAPSQPDPDEAHSPGQHGTTKLR